MNDFQREIYKTIDRLTRQKLEGLGFDISKRGKVISVNSNVAIVQIDGENYTCKLRRGINVIPNDIVYVKFPQNNESDKYIETILGVNEVTETMEITAEEILAKLKTVDGTGSGLDADLLDGKHASEFATLDDLEDMDVDISGEAIVTNINTSQSIIDDKNLSENVNDAINKKHSHTNKVVIDNIGQSDIDTWNAVSGKSEIGHKHTESDIADLDKYTKAEIDTKLNLKANESDIPTKLSELTKDISFDERYYTETESDAKYEPKNNNIQSHISSKSNPHNITKGQLNLGDVENKSSSTIRSEITDGNVISALGYTPENSANKGVANGYAPLDSNIKIPLHLLPDVAKQQTYVVETIIDRDNLTSLIMGEKCYITSTGDSYIWDGDSWEILAKADWENVNLQWTNIVGKPNSNVSDIDNTVSVRHSHSNKSLIDTITQTLIDRWNAAWTHISDTIKHITAGERNKWNTVDNKADTIYVNTELNKKSDKSHLHTELDISDLDKYTKAETDTKLSGKVDNSRVLADVPHNAKFTDTIYTLPVASSAILGGIKIGANLTISEDGTLSAIDSDERSSFIIKQEIFIANEGQTVFNLTKGSYQPNTNTLSVYLYGGKQPNTILNEISSASFEITLPLKDGDIVIVEYIELSSATPYPIHGNDHLLDGYDPMPLATVLSEGLMSKDDKFKLDGIENGANKYAHPSTHSLDIITETTSKKILTATERVKISEVDNKVDKIIGKGLSDENYTLTERNKLSGIEVGANKYIHPANHPASMITESSSQRFVLDSEKATWDTVISKADKDYVDTELDKKANTIDIPTKLSSFTKDINFDERYYTETEMNTLLGDKVDNSRVLTDVPLNAKFTDTNTTYSEITTAEIDAGTASTLRTITARRVQYILDKVSNIISNAISALTKADIDLGSVDNTSDLDKPISIATQTALNGKVNNNQVLTNVPSGAKFTDTVTTINDKTGAISKADITALGIPAQDTVYTHPSTHPASMIAESTSRRFVSDTEKATWSNKAEVSDIPTKVSELSNDSNYVTQGELGDAGFGDMVKSVYDQNNNGIVDNAEKLGGKSPNYYQQALGFTPVNKAGDVLNGSYTGNGKLFLKNSFYGMGGQALSDFSMSGIYNRQELINVAHKGGVEVNIEGAGSVSRTKENLNLMFNGEPDFLNISGVNTTTTKIEIIADLGHRAEVYSDANWQPFVQLRIAPGGSHNWFNKIKIEVSDDKVNWSYPDDETAWGTDDFLNNQAIPSLWMGKNASPKPSYSWRYIRFIFTDIRGNSGNFWISQLGMRHRNAPYTKKYLTATGDKMYGALDMNNNKITNVANPTNQNDAATKGYVDAKQICHISDMPPSNKNLPWIDTSL